MENTTRGGERPQEPRTSGDVGNCNPARVRALRGNFEPDMRAEKGSWSVYLLCWRRHGGLQYIGMSQDVDRRINAHRKAGRLPFAPLGDPAVEVLHFGLDVYAACDAERREIMARRAMTPHGYNESSGGEYAGSRSDTLFSSDHAAVVGDQWFWNRMDANVPRLS